MSKSYEFEIRASDDEVTMTHSPCGEVVIDGIDLDLTDLIASSNDHICPDDDPPAGEQHQQ